MSSSVKQSVRYWGFLFLKFLVAGGITIGLVLLLDVLWPQPKPYEPIYIAYLVVNCLIFSTALGLFYLAILDQRYRCRVCLRRLRMPVLTGSCSSAGRTRSISASTATVS
jgi:hypothetical protein